LGPLYRFSRSALAGTRVLGSSNKELSAAGAFLGLLERSAIQMKNAAGAPSPPQDVTSQVQAQKVRSVIRFARGGLILDAGCGDGRVSRALAKRGLNVIGCDRSHWQVRSSKIGDEGNDNKLEACVASLTHLPFRDSSFEAVCCLDVLEHIPELPDAIREITRVIQIGGSLIVAIPATAHGLIYDKILLRTSISKYVLTKLGYLDHIEEGHFHVRIMTPRMARLQLEGFGMKVDSFLNVSFLSTYLETARNLLSVLGLGEKRPLNTIIALDLKIAKYLPLALGSSWLIVLHRTGGAELLGGRTEPSGLPAGEYDGRQI